MTQEELKQLINSLLRENELLLKHFETTENQTTIAFWRGMISARNYVIKDLQYFLEDELEERM
jgi:hypothetical protein